MERPDVASPNLMMTTLTVLRLLSVSVWILAEIPMDYNFIRST